MTAKKSARNPKKPSAGLSLLQAVANQPTGVDRVLDYMISMNKPLTWEQYAATAYGEALEDLTPEQIASFPAGLK